MQLWLAVKNLLPLHTVPVQPGLWLNRSNTPFANDVLLVTKMPDVPKNCDTKIPSWPFPLMTLFSNVTTPPAFAEIIAPAPVFPLITL
jgi:hypothetical protein